MAHLIDKDALVAEIKRKKEEEVNYDDDSKSFASYADHIYYSALDSMQDFINTLEVKEIDLDKEIDSVEDRYYGFESLSRADIIDIAKHFFKLGLKAKQG